MQQCIRTFVLVEYSLIRYTLTSVLLASRIKWKIKKKEHGKKKKSGLFFSYNERTFEILLILSKDIITLTDFLALNGFCMNDLN